MSRLVRRVMLLSLLCFGSGWSSGYANSLYFGCDSNEYGCISVGFAGCCSGSCKCYSGGHVCVCACCPAV